MGDHGNGTYDSRDNKLEDDFGVLSVKLENDRPVTVPKVTPPDILLGTVSKPTENGFLGTVSTVTPPDKHLGTLSKPAEYGSLTTASAVITPSDALGTTSKPAEVKDINIQNTSLGTTSTATKATTGTVSEVGTEQPRTSTGRRSPRNRANTSCWQHDINYTDVVIIGNGPSGISLSYMLSGHWPYYTGAPHPNEYLQLRLQNKGSEQSLLEMDLEFLSGGLEGRSSNPVALLFDNLTHPDADLGVERPSLLHWVPRDDRVVGHVVLGQQGAGGAWQMMEGDMQTLSLGTWMQLPNLPFKEWLAQYRCEMQERSPDYYLPPIQNRASMEEVRAYYLDYVRRQGLEPYFRSHATVTSVERVLDVCHSIDVESGEQQPCSKDHSGKVKWEVRGHQMTPGLDGEGTTTEFCYRAPNVVLATGSYDTPNKLGVAGEGREYVLHSLSALEAVIKSGAVTPDSDPIMIVGAGLSAADAILCTSACDIPVVHVFRRDTSDPRIVLRQLPAILYPEYHSVLKMMEQGEDEHYLARPSHQVLECLQDGKVLLQDRSLTQGSDALVQVSYVVVLVGSRPDLSFLPESGHNIGVVPGMPIHPKNNPVHVDSYSYQSVYECGLYAMGPLVGDNFVRFLRGGALGIASHLIHKKEGLL